MLGSVLGVGYEIGVYSELVIIIDIYNVFVLCYAVKSFDLGVTFWLCGFSTLNEFFNVIIVFIFLRVVRIKSFMIRKVLE